MSKSRADFWNQRYATPEYIYGTLPNAFLASQQHRFLPGMRALVPGDGEGRNGVWLAQRGLDVLTVDFSALALEKAAHLADRAGVPLKTECIDLMERIWEVDTYDRVVSIFLHFTPDLRPDLHQSMFRALKPGGLLLLEAFTPAQQKYRSGGPSALEMLYTGEMLLADLPGARVIELDETEVELAEGEHHRGTAAVVRALLQKLP